MDKDTPPTVASDAGRAEVDGAVAAAPAECDASAGNADGALVAAGDVSAPPSASAGVGAGAGAGAGAAPLMRVSQPTPGSDTAAARAATAALAPEQGTGTTQEVLVSQDELERRFGVGETLYKRLDGQDLGKDGGSIESGSEAGQEAVLLALQELQTCSWLVRRLMVFSSNESLDDVNTSDMRFLFIEHYIGNLLNMVRSQDRRPLVSASRVNHQAFLTQLGNMKAVSDGETAIVSGEASSNSQDVRARKIERFKQKRALEQRSTVLRRLQARLGDGEDGMLEEQQRELLKVQLDMAIMESVDAIVSLDEETKMLEYMAARGIRPSDPRPAAEPEPELDPHRPGLDIMHISADFKITRENFKATVFRPGHRLPTMSLEEYADKEVADAIERGQREKEAEETRVKKYSELEELGLEDDEELVDQATLKARNWDLWKDEHPYGAGNTKRI